MSVLLNRLNEGGLPELEADMRRVVADLRALVNRVEIEQMRLRDYTGSIAIISQLTIATEYIENFLPKN